MSLGTNLQAGDSETERLRQIMERDSQTMTLDILEAMLSAGKSAKPIGYDRHQSRIQRFFCGHARGLTVQALKKRYPQTYGQMSVLPVNMVKQKADLDAQVYREPPRRVIKLGGEVIGAKVVDEETGETSTQLEAELGRLASFEEMLKRARLDRTLPQAEARTEASRTHFLRVHWDNAHPNPERWRFDVRMFWPHLVWVIPDERLPDQLWAARGLVAQIQGPPIDEAVEHDEAVGGLSQRTSVKRNAQHDAAQSRGPRVYETWRRIADLGPTEQATVAALAAAAGRPPVAGGWLVDHIREDGERVGGFVYALPTLPWLGMYASYNEGGLFLDEERDLVDIQESINVAVSNHLLKDDFQGHAQFWISGDTALDGQELVSAPGALWKLKAGSTVGAINSDFDLTSLESVERLLVMYGRTQRQPPDAWQFEPGPPMSGVSRSIRNGPSDQKREENEENYKELEELELLPLLQEIWDAIGGRDLGLAPVGGPGITYGVRFQPTEVVEEPEAKRLRASNMMRDGWVSVRRAAVMGGAYKTEEEAAAAGVPDVLLPIQADAPTSRATVPGSDAPPDQQEGVAAEGGEATTDEVLDETSEQGVTVNELSLSAQRFASFGDVAGVNKARDAWAKALGTTLPAVSGLGDTGGGGEE